MLIRLLENTYETMKLQLVSFYIVYLNSYIFLDDGKPKSKDGIELDVVYEKMSKSKHNGVDPLQVLDRDGVDLTRLQILSAAAPRQFINWGEDGMSFFLHISTVF